MSAETPCKKPPGRGETTRRVKLAILLFPQRKIDKLKKIEG